MRALALMTRKALRIGRFSSLTGGCEPAVKRWGWRRRRLADLFIFLAALHAPGVTRPLIRTPKLLKTGSGLARASHRV